MKSSGNLLRTSVNSSAAGGKSFFLSILDPRRARACAPYLNFVPCYLGRAASPFAAVFLRVADEEGFNHQPSHVVQRRAMAGG